MKYQICSQKLLNGTWSPSFRQLPSIISSSETMTVSEPSIIVPPKGEVNDFSTKDKANAYVSKFLTSKGISKNNIRYE